MKTIIAIYVLVAMCALGSAYAQGWHSPQDIILGKGTVPFSSDENRDSPPVISSPAKPLPAASGQFLTRILPFKPLIVALPALSGLAVLVGHLLLQSLRWHRSREAVAEGRERPELQEERAAQSRWILTLVQREKRRAAERAQLAKMREAAALRRPTISHPEKERRRSRGA